MDLFRFKVVLADFYYRTKLSEYKLKRLNRNPNYIRIVNYHGTPKESLKEFEKQLQWYENNFCLIDYTELKQFLDGHRSFHEKPGLLLTFDDGKKSNYSYGRPLLNKYKIKGIFFVSSDSVGSEGYMNWSDIKSLIAEGHSIGSHTATHHRMLENDSLQLLDYEVKTSKETIEKNATEEIDSFCWCGGEEEHYTARAAQLIEATYQYSFLTNSYPVYQDTNHLLLERTNIEANWGIPLVLFQVCGIIDAMYIKKRKRVETLISQIVQ